MQLSRDHGILFSLILIGAFLRLYTLSFNSLWLDEIYTLTISGLSMGEIWAVSTTTDFMPPLFYWIEHGMVVFGTSEWVLRLVPALFGIAVIPVAYLIGREFADENTGLVMATLFTFSPFLIRYSQEARSYMPALFFVALAFLFYLRKDYYLLAVVSALAFWMHYYSILFTGILIVLVVITDYKKGFITAGLFTLLTLPLWLSFPQLLALRTGVGATFGDYGADLIWSVYVSVGSINLITAFCLFMLFMTGIIMLFAEKPQKGMLLLSLVMIPLVVSIFLSSFVPMVPRYMIFITIPFYLGAAIIPGCYEDKRVVYCIMIFLALLFMPVVVQDTTTYSKEDWRGIGTTLADLTSDGDTVVISPGYVQRTLDHYYRDNSTEIGVSNLAEMPGDPDWFVVTNDLSSVDRNGELRGWLDNNTQVVVPGKVRILKVA